MTMMKYLMAAGMAAAVFALTACSAGKGTTKGIEPHITTAQKAESSDGRAEYVKLGPEEAKKVMDSNDELILVDVRTAEEYAESRIGNAINIPVEAIGNELPEELPDLDAEIMVYCRSGVRSKSAANKLLDLGYKHVTDIGGIKDWPYETVAGDEK